MLSIGKLGRGQERYYLDYADPRVMPTSGKARFVCGERRNVVGIIPAP